ncbi:MULTISPECIES: sensor histidine kinase [unclassified Pseudoalteromonas]|uniref:sensor histidine kinase n=1 Tax=unclassified Pseudoalteromonas TaxID=194690 RepID=UPI0005A6C28B|nr:MULTISPECIES: histidine kinase [unclassified Pseudoalteromonas]
MLRHPFFKYSFLILLFIDLIFTIGLILAGINDISLDTLKATTIWFVCFYWLPVWLSAAIILKLRNINIHYTILELIISIIALTLGLMVTEKLLQFTFSEFKSMGAFVIFGGFTWAVPIYFVSRFIEHKKGIAIEKSAREQAQLETLRYQLNPHFMFNSLNTISAYIHTKPDLADEVLHELADILRYSLDTAQTKSISLQQEIDIINKYFNIEKARFGDRLTVNYDISDTLLTQQIPPLLLQPIVENAIKHNAKQTELIINIKVEKQDDLLKVIISDNGSGFNETILSQGYGKGVGMKNLQQRVTQLNQGKMTLNNKNGAEVLLEMAI